MRITPVTPHVGAYISDIDLAEEQAPEVYQQIRQAFLDHGVVFFRDQHLNSEQYVALAKRFGKPVLPTSGIIPALPGSDVIAEVKKERDRNIGGSWHTDQSHLRAPSWATMLLCRKRPASGGDTLFANMMAAYEQLSEGLKATLKPLRAVHCNAGVHARMGTGRTPDPEVLHPVIAHHPESGRPILYVNPGYTMRFDGWTEAESKSLLDYLFQEAIKPTLTCRFQWEVGSLAFWDNLSTWHFAVNDYGIGERVMHRIVINGPTVESF